MELTVNPTELLNLGVGALSLIVMYALIRLVQSIVKSNSAQSEKGNETENLQAQTNLKLVENQLQMGSMFEKLEASIAFNASATQKQTDLLGRIETDGKRQIETLADIKNTFSTTNVATAVQVAQQSTANQIIQEHSEILTVTRASQQLQTEQIKAMQAVADRIERLPTTEEVQKTVQQELSQVAELLSKMTKVETELISMRTEVVLLLTKLMQLPATVTPATEGAA